MPENLHGHELPEGWLDLDAAATAALAAQVGVDLSVLGKGTPTARQIRMLMLAEMTAEFAAENALNRLVAVSKRWLVFTDEELERIEHAFASYDAADSLLAEILAEVERRRGA